MIYQFKATVITHDHWNKWLMHWNIVPMEQNLFISFPGHLVLMASWHSTLQWWCGSFEDSRSTQCLLHPKKPSPLASLQMKCPLSFFRTGEEMCFHCKNCFSLSLAQSDKPNNIHPELGISWICPKHCQIFLWCNQPGVLFIRWQKIWQPPIRNIRHVKFLYS